MGVDLAPPWTRRGEAELRLDALAWESPWFDLAAFDAEISALAARGVFAIALFAGDPGVLERAAVEVLTRAQRVSPRRNAASRGPRFDRILARHRALHDLSRPLVRADLDHALDTWQWVLRLHPTAGAALQAAALFHDIERLASEADARVEHRAPDYQAFKDAHAAEGARIARRALSGLLPPDEIERAVALVGRHERPEGGPDLALLNEADALSFFSLNSGGFMRYFGLEHTRVKVAYTLRRLGPSGRRTLFDLRHPPAVASLVAEELARLAAAGEEEGAP
ncbi:MAG: DUF4202 family protein [Polyangiaceae bacterium]|nr:DUF4202 family protein [Polyangiaceae bacterium]